MKGKGNSLIEVYRLVVMWAATAIEAVFGKTDGIFLTLIIFMSLDYITGVLNGIVGKRLSSKIGATGIAKKIGILCIVSLASFIERYIIDTTALRAAVTLYYISNEGISIFENITKLGVPVPKKLSNVVNNLSDDDRETQ